MAMTDDPLDQDLSLDDAVAGLGEWRIAEERRGDPFSAVLHATTDDGVKVELPLTPELLEAVRDVDDAQQEALGYDPDDDANTELAALAVLDDEEDRETGRRSTTGATTDGGGFINRARRVETIDKAFKTVGTDFADGLWNKMPPMGQVIVLAIAALIVIGLVIAVLINAAIQ